MEKKDKNNNQKDSYLTDDLASLESYIHDLFHFSALPLCFVSNIGVLLEANPCFEDLSQYKSFEIVGEPIERIFPKKAMEKLAKETMKKGVIEGRAMKLINKKGKEISVSVFTKVRKNDEDEIVGYFLTPLDVRKQKKKEERLKKNIKDLEGKLKECKKKKKK